MLSVFIKEKRASLGLSQADLGKLVPVSQAFVNKLEHGAPIPLDKVREWAVALKLTDDERPKFYDLCLAAQSSELASSVKDLRARLDDLTEDFNELLHKTGPFTDPDQEKSSLQFLDWWRALPPDQQEDTVLRLKRLTHRLWHKLPKQEQALLRAVGHHMPDQRLLPPPGPSA